MINTLNKKLDVAEGKIVFLSILTDRIFSSYSTLADRLGVFTYILEDFDDRTTEEVAKELAELNNTAQLVINQGGIINLAFNKLEKRFPSAKRTTSTPQEFDQWKNSDMAR